MTDRNFLLLLLQKEEYKCIAQQWVKKKQGFILVYSLIDDVSFGNLKAFFDLIQDEYLNEDEESGGKIPPIVLVGNKVDLDRQRKVSTAQGQALATQWGAKFFETRCVGQNWEYLTSSTHYWQCEDEREHRERVPHLNSYDA